MKLVSLIALSTTLSLGGAASAAEPVLTATLTCQRVAGPGRLLCELSTQARTGKLVWSDALVVRAPEFARPLRSRFLAQLDSSGGPRAAAKLALVASAAGRGKLELLARGVVCSEGPSGEWCGPELAPVTALIEVDPAPSPGPAAP